MWYIYLFIGAFFFLGFGGWAMHRARRELAATGSLSRPTFIAAFIAYVGHGCTVLVSAFLGVLALQIVDIAAWSAGGVIMACGAFFWIGAHTQFRSFRLTWGLETERLVTTGIYAYSRNPQTVGSVLFWIGAGVAGESGVAILLAVIEFLAMQLWLPVEERILEQRHGAPYARYRRRVARWVGLPRREPGEGEGEGAVAVETAAAE